MLYELNIKKKNYICPLFILFLSTIANSLFTTE